ncbi:MAG: CDP-alcohol phosphatidyltransferase family protein [Planctomycetes bacterium]|nr:CDP-alcohol phosphatidyltransferase family protein [Planctomycetota bacterium]
MSVPRWLPNAISVLRVLLVPAWVLLAEAANLGYELNRAERGDELRLWAALVLVAIGLSDVLDGWLARRFDLRSKLGATLDAVADKLAQVVLTTWLALRAAPAFPEIPLWFLLLLIARDGLLLVGYVVIKRRHGAVHTEHELHGKASSLCLFGLLLAFSFAAPPAVTTPWLVVSTAIVLWSTAAYVRRGVAELRR